MISCNLNIGKVKFNFAVRFLSKPYCYIYIDFFVTFCFFFKEKYTV